jgi:replication factor A1
MKISEIKDGMIGVRLTAKINDIGEARTVNTRYGKETTVATATISDDSGEAKLTLWAEQIDKLKPGDTVEITNGMVKEWQGQIQVSVGRRGELKVI